MPHSRYDAVFDNSSRYLDRFGLVLGLTVVSVVGLALIDFTGPVSRLTAEVGSLASVILVGTTLLFALRASGLNLRRQRILDIVVGIAVLIYITTIALDLATGGSNDSVSGASPILVGLSVAAPVVVVLRLVRHREVTTGTILGAISAYLLVAVAFFFVFLTLQGHSGNFFTSREEQPSSSFMYFSLTTITTVGYGDLTAATKLGRLMATTEAVLGQVYLVTFVAMIVGLRAQAWRDSVTVQDMPAPDDDEGPSQQ